MAIQENFSQIDKLDRSRGHIEFSEEFFSSLNKDLAQEIADRYAPNLLFKLPAAEIKFFEWLKKNDEAIWTDLWGNDEREAYIVGISFLPVVMDESRGFPICDLENNDNYFFSTTHMPDDESKIFLDAVQERFLDKQPLTVAQLLAMEINLAPIDIWRFCYRHGIDIARAKNAVAQLVEDKILIHLPQADQLVHTLDF